VRDSEPAGFVILSEVLMDGEPMTSSAMVAQLRDGKIAQAHSYLTTDDMLEHFRLIQARGR
jgi:ketosteroid isomerase-like protein